MYKVAGLWVSCNIVDGKGALDSSREKEGKRFMEKQRLDKIIGSTGKWSRREVKNLVRQGLVLVNGVPAKSVEQKMNPENSEIIVNGEALIYRSFTWVMLNKPAGYLSATEDGHGKTVLDLLPPELQKQGLFPVGRLDKDTEGLLLLTNEGGLAHELLSPRHHVEKVYYVRVAGRLTDEDCIAFSNGMNLGDTVVLLPAGLEILSVGEESEAHVTLREGKFHQIKRMFAHQGKPVLYLERIRMGNLPLDGSLSRGEFRFLTEEEIDVLRNK